MNYESSWTTPGENFFKEAVKVNLKPDNPGAKVGDAVKIIESKPFSKKKKWEVITK